MDRCFVQLFGVDLLHVLEVMQFEQLREVNFLARLASNWHSL